MRPLTGLVDLLLYGAPGSGKGTQAQALRERLGVPQVSTGDILRAEVAAGSELGRRAQEIMGRGELVPDDVMVGIIRRRLALPDAVRGFILDGYPRTVPQALALDEVLTGFGRHVDRVLYLRVDDEVLVRRLSDRWTCPTCQRTYSSSNPPAEGNRCRHDGSALFQREDDRPETARTRIAVYLAKTLPVLEHYRAQGLVSEIDGLGSLNEVRDRIFSVLGL